MNYLVFAVHGHDPRYTTGLVRTLAQIPALYGRGWQAIVFASLAPGAVDIEALAPVVRMPHVFFRAVNEVAPLWLRYPGRFWRLLALRDLIIRDHVGSLVCHRDADSRILAREVLAVQAWAKSSHQFHIMRDHPNHCPRVMLAGMWGWKVPPRRSDNVSWILGGVVEWLETRLSRGEKPPWSNDTFMREEVYPRVGNDALVHDAFDGAPFPDGLTTGPFVGEAMRVVNGEDAVYAPDRKIRDDAVAKMVLDTRPEIV